MNETFRDHTAINRSVHKIFLHLAAGVALVAICVWFINGGVVGTRGEGTVYIGWFGAVFFGSCLPLIIHRLIVGHRKPVELTAQGFWDKRVLTQAVPWSAVSRISVWSFRALGGRETSMLRVQFAREAILRDQLTPVPKATRWLNKSLGLDGVYIASGDLDISFSELCTLFQRYLSEYNPTATDDTK